MSLDGLPRVKRQNSDRVVMDPSELESASSLCLSVPAIHVPIKVKEMLRKALINCGSEVNVISDM